MSRLEQTSRVALAAMLHDLGKFAERARIDEAQEKDADGNIRVDINKQLYCPSFNNKYSHAHAAYTAIGMDIIERQLPEITGSEMKPFASWRTKETDDSLINAAAKHHKPETFLQWVIATADRVSSGFERKSFHQTDADTSETAAGNHYTAKQLTIFEQIALGDQKKPHKLEYCYPLEPVSVNTLFPVKRGNAESESKKQSQAKYKKMWSSFAEALEQIPLPHRKNLPLWLDHFDSLWQAYTANIPSATANKFNKDLIADVSLYDHSKTTAALAAALWRYHNDTQQTDTKLEDWDAEKLLLIQGDFFGIQDFIFATGGETGKWAAKLLRGRSFYVSLLMECAAQKLLEKLDLPVTSQVINAAGKFLIVAPNTEETKEHIKQIQKEFDEWFIKNTYAKSGIGIASLAASCSDLTHGNFPQLMKRLFTQLDRVKLQRFQMCTSDAPMIFNGYLDEFDNTRGVCSIDGISPATQTYKGIEICSLAKDQITVGDNLTKLNRLLITTNNVNHNTLTTDIFGYYISFTESENISGMFGALAKEKKLLKAIDFSLPEDNTGTLWNGYAKRAINAYVPRYTETDLSENLYSKYKDSEEGLGREIDHVKNLGDIAGEDRMLDKDSNWIGITALSTLKGDVDNLGEIFQKGLGEHPSFARMASLSRQLNSFFSVWLPYYCSCNYKNTYTVFAGGDDFFMIGPWRSSIKLAEEMQQKFAEYVAHNENVHFSAGVSVNKASVPVRHISVAGEESLEAAKEYTNPHTEQKKNAVTCFGQTVSWADYSELLLCSAQLDEIKSRYELSTGYIYSLLEFIEMEDAIATKPENSIWYSRFKYRTFRMLEQKKIAKDKIATILEQISHSIVAQGIRKFGKNYRIAIFIHLYQNRRG